MTQRVGNSGASDNSLAALCLVGRYLGIPANPGKLTRRLGVGQARITAEDLQA